MPWSGAMSAGERASKTMTAAAMTHTIVATVRRQRARAIGVGFMLIKHGHTLRGSLCHGTDKNVTRRASTNFGAWHRLASAVGWPHVDPARERRPDRVPGVADKRTCRAYPVCAGCGVVWPGGRRFECCGAGGGGFWCCCGGRDRAPQLALSGRWRLSRHQIVMRFREPGRSRVSSYATWTTHAVSRYD